MIGIYIPIVLFFVVEIMFYVSNYSFLNFIFVDKGSFLLGLFIFYLIYFLLYGITNNTKYSFLILSITSYIIVVSSIIKIAFSEEPFYISDLLYFNSGGEIFSIIEGSIWSTLKPYLLLFIIILIIIIGLNVLVFKFNNKCSNKIKRISFIVISILFLLILFIPNKKLDQYIIKHVYNSEERNDYGLMFLSNVDYYVVYSHMGGIYGNLLESRIFISDDYDEDKIDEVLNSIEEVEDKSLNKPNIIVVFSESFWDIDQLDEIKFDKPVTSNFNKLKEVGLFYDMISPSFGGLSANVEFEFLTGGSLNYFSNGYIPYMNLYNKGKDSISIINELNNNDYYTKLVLYTSPDLFNCQKFYKVVKPDSVEYNTDVDEEYFKGKYVSDEYVVDSIINTFDNKDKDEKLFYFTATMQAHMPYVLSKYNEYDIDIVESNLSKEENEVIKSYAQGVYDADKQLGRLYDYIQSLDEDTIIIFYGDHLPYLSYGDSNAMNELEFFNTDDNKLNLFRKYNTQALVLANYDISSLKEENKDIKYLGPDLLSTYLLNHMDIELSDYYKWLYSTINIIGASNKFISVNQNGDLFYTQKLEDEMKELNDFRYNVQYKYFIK